MTPSRCHRCGAAIAYAYVPGDELVTLDAERAAAGNFVLEPGKVSGHRVAPGAGTHRVHVCPPTDAPEKLTSGVERRG